MNKTKQDTEKSDIEVIFIHDNMKEHSYLLTRLREYFNSVRLIEDPDEGAKYIAKHAPYKTIVVLDIDFGDGVTNGYEILNDIRKRSFLIEIIILSASDLHDGKIMERIPQIVELNPSNYVIRGNPGWEDMIIEAVFKAKTKIDSSVSGAIEEWIATQEQKKRSEPFMISAYGKEYSLDDILNEVRLQTEFGQRFEKDLMILTIDRLVRKKENLK